MEPQTNNSKKDFSIVFEEVEKFFEENSAYHDNGIMQEDLQNDESIREFTEICREISDSGSNPTVYLTFS